MSQSLAVIDFMTAKKQGTSKRARRTFDIRPNGRSTDFIAPGLATGCSLACSYCYVARHRAYGNPLEVYTNRQEAWNMVKMHYKTLGKKTPNQCDPTYWTYDIGESTDCLLPANINNTGWYIQQFQSTEAKPCFATKIAGARSLPVLINRGMARVRVSLAPQSVVSTIEKGTSSIQTRINGMQELFDRGYEVHINFSPVVVYEGWSKDYVQLFKQLDKKLSAPVKQQLKCEVIFLTHSPSLHQANLQWNPSAEEMLWKPEWQEQKTTQRGDCDVVRYRAIDFKNHLVSKFRELLAQVMPYCSIRYIF